MSNYWGAIEKIIAVAVFFQALELAHLTKLCGNTGIWRWSTLKKEFRAVHHFLGMFLSGRSFRALVVVQMLCAVGLFVWPHFVFGIALFFSVLLVCIRFRGSLNGGSDAMTLLVLGGVCVARFFGPESRAAGYAMAYIAIQLTLSYFIAGCAKAAHRGWWTGRVITDYAAFEAYQMPESLRRRLKGPRFARWAGWWVLAFELGFPLAWVGRPSLVFFLSVCFLFHLANTWALGLSRFFWAWMAAFPALCYWVLERPSSF